MSRHENRNGNQQQSQQKDQQQNQQKKKGNARPFAALGYNLTVARRYIGTLLQEGFLAAVFVLPFALYFYLTKTKTVTIDTQFWSLWAIMVLVFLLQNAMFRRN